MQLTVQVEQQIESLQTQTKGAQGNANQRKFKSEEDDKRETANRFKVVYEFFNELYQEK